MDKEKLLDEIMELKKIIRKLEDFADDNEVGDISEDKIYVAMVTYCSALRKVLRLTKE